MIPETRYARAGDLHIAYQTVGDGTTDVILADQWFSNVDGQWDVPPLAELRRRLASFAERVRIESDRDENNGRHAARCREISAA